MQIFRDVVRGKVSSAQQHAVDLEEPHTVHFSCCGSACLLGVVKESQGVYW